MSDKKEIDISAHLYVKLMHMYELDEKDKNVNMQFNQDGCTRGKK